MIAIQPSQPIQKQESSFETLRVPAVEISLIRERFNGGQLIDSKVLSTDIIYTSATRKKEKITQETINLASEALAQGQTVTANTLRRGHPVATIIPHLNKIPFVNDIRSANTQQIPNRHISLTQGPVAQGPAAARQQDIFSSLTAPIIANALTNALGAAIKDLLTESPAEKAKRQQEEKLAAETKHQELTSLQQEAIAEKNELTSKISQKASPRSQETNAEISALSGMVTSQNRETVESAIALSQSLESRLDSQHGLNSQYEIDQPITLSNGQEINKTAANTLANSYQGTLEEMTGNFRSLKQETILELQESYSIRGAEGKFLSTVLETLTMEAPSFDALSETGMIISSAPEIFQDVISDLLESLSTQSSLTAEAVANDTGIDTAPETVPFSRYMELESTLESFSFSPELRESLAA